MSSSDIGMVGSVLMEKARNEVISAGKRNDINQESQRESFEEGSLQSYSLLCWTS